MVKMLIYGASGLGREVLDMMEDINNEHESYEITGWLDDGIDPGTTINSVKVLGNIDYLRSLRESYAIVLAIAEPKIKEKLYKSIKSIKPDILFPQIVHPSSSVSPLSQLGEGVIISRYCWVTANTKLGKLVFLNTRCDIGHDSVIGDFSSLMPSVNISGNVIVGKKSLIGVQSAIHQGLKIGDESIIGIGSKVLTDVPSHCTVLGYPARVIQRHAVSEGSKC